MTGMANDASGFSIAVVDSNEFNEGWLAYVLGIALDAGRSQIYMHGWKMAEETVTLSDVRSVFKKQRDLERPQYVVSAFGGRVSDGK